MYTRLEPFTTPIICAKINCMAWLPDPDGGGLLATGNTSSAVSVAIVESKPHTIAAYKVCVLKPVLSSIMHPQRPHLKDVTHVSWSQKYQFLASCHGYNHVLIWDRHGNRVTNKPVVIIRDESSDVSRIIPAVTVRWAHSQPILLITYEDGIMKLVYVTSDINSSHISVHSISFTDAHFNGDDHVPEEDAKWKSSCWSQDDQMVFSASEDSLEIVVTSVNERRIVSKITVEIRVEELFSHWCDERGQLLVIHHPCAAISILQLDTDFKKISEKLVLTPFAIGSTKMAVRERDGLIAVSGCVRSLHANMVAIYHSSGSLMKKVVTPCSKLITALCWVGKSSLSVATKNHVHNIVVSKEIPTLEFLAGQAVSLAQRKIHVSRLSQDLRMNFDLVRRTLPKNTPRVFTDTESASQCTLRVVKGTHSIQEAQFMVAEIGGEAVALRAIKQTALISLGVHYEILLRNDCMRTDEEQLALLNRHTTHTGAPKTLNCSYSENFSLALRMSHKPLSRGTTTVSSLGSKSTVFYGIHYSEKRSLLTVHLYNSASGESKEPAYIEATGLINRPAARGEDHAKSVVLLYEGKEVFQLLQWQKAAYSVRYKAPFSMCAAFCTAVNCISRKLI